MTSFISKQPSSRPIRYQTLAYAGGGASVPSTNFSSETWQVRVVSEVQGWITFGDGTSVSCTAQSGSAKINANTDGAPFWTVSPSQMCAFNSTSTSTGMISITEMA
jgi:hypothetical protein